MNSDNGSSSNQRQHIEAINFDAPGERQSPSPRLNQQDEVGGALRPVVNVKWWHSQFNMMLSVFGLLVLAAVLFVVLTPPPEAANLSTVVESDGSTRTAQATEQEQIAPWDESRRAQARTDSQEILADLLDSKKGLESKNVSEWAAEPYDAALLRAAEGDDFYKRQDFANAMQQYQGALDDLRGIDALIPDVLASRVSAGQQAIDDGKTGLAKEQFQAALRLEPNHIPALSGLDRAKNLDQVLEIVRAASANEQDFLASDELAHLNQAEQKLQQALALDAQMLPAKEGLARVQQRAADKRFRDAMSQGFSALFKGSYASARKGFSSALKIRPGDPTASAAYRQSLASDKRSSLSSLISVAKRFEAQEEWASALSNYQVVLQRDPNQVAAKLGQIRSQARLDLDQEINSVLADTLALSRSSQSDRANAVLSDARAINSKGAKLSSQIASIESALQQLDSTVKVSFQSDALTDINLTKAGANKVRLGRFTTKKLALKPGRYVLTGSRLGYRDVRQEIELRANSSSVQTFKLVCNEPIAGNASLNNHTLTR